jgi:catechol 2,3-dioxygenase-like lactoylglutathione lyase family enzyme
MSELEHLNVTVRDAVKTAEKLCELFDWRIRWQGASIHEGYSVHVGSPQSYLALYSPSSETKAATDSYKKHGGLNHLGIVVDDLEVVEEKVKARGYETHNHQDYEPGRRFYFDDENGIEFEVISYK